jgi:hypothetical protein
MSILLLNVQFWSALFMAFVKDALKSRSLKTFITQFYSFVTVYFKEMSGGVVVRTQRSK